MRRRILEAKLHEKWAVVTEVRVSSGEVLHTAEELGFWLLTQNETFYTDTIWPISQSLKSAGFDVKIKSNFTVTLGDAIIQGTDRWRLGLKADQESEELLSSVSTKGALPATPGVAIIREYAAFSRNYKADSLSLGEVMLCFTEETKLNRDAIPALRGGIIASPAEKRRLYKNIRSYDITSAYPSTVLAYTFPSGPSEKVSVDNLTVQENGLITGGSWEPTMKGYIGKFTATNVRRKEWVRFPSVDQNSDYEDLYNTCEFDRIGLTYAESFTFSACAPEVALFNLQYEYDSITVEELYIHDMAMLPSSTTEFIKNLYDKKLAGEKLTKVKINSLIGCWGRSPLNFIGKTAENMEEAEKHLSIYNGGEKKPSSMGTLRTWDQRWAVYAVSRIRLTIGMVEKELHEIGCEMLYCDTDGIKITGSTESLEKSAEVIAKFNSGFKRRVDYKGIGLFKDESDEYNGGAIFYGKKAYLADNGDSSIRPTCSGIPRASLTEQLSSTMLSELEWKNVVVRLDMWRLVKPSGSYFGLEIVPQLAQCKIVLGKDI